MERFQTGKVLKKDFDEKIDVDLLSLKVAVDLKLEQVERYLLNNTHINLLCNKLTNNLRKLASHDRQFNSLSDSTLKAVEFSEKDYTAISSFNELNLKKQFSKTTKIANFIKYRKPSFKKLV